MKLNISKLILTVKCFIVFYTSFQNKNRKNLIKPRKIVFTKIIFRNPNQAYDIKINKHF